MGNPTILVEPFSSSLGAFTGVDPIRFDGGLWLEEATTNLYKSPRFANLTHWSTFRCTLEQDATVTKDGVPSGKLTLNNTGGNVFSTTDAIAAAPGEVFTLSGWALCNGSSKQAQPTFNFYDVSNVLTGSGGSKTVNLTVGEWTYFEYTSSAAPASTTYLRAYLGTNGVNTDVFWFVQPVVEKRAYATSYVDGTLGTGYAWTGTANASSSTRSASSAAISPSGILSPSSGALAFRITPTIETGVEEIWGECGVKGSGTDHLRWGRDASKHPFAEWSANDAAYQRLTGSETLNALTAYDLYLGHSATTISLAVDAGTLQTGTRDAVSASWGAGNLTLEATKGGVVYNQFATFNRTLSASEIKTLDRRNSWSRTMFGNPFAYFQLRPY